MDFATGLVGAPHGISWQAIREDMYVEQHRGPGNTAVGSRHALRRVAAWLERVGLIEMRSNARQRLLVFYLPKAYTRSRALRKPALNPHINPPEDSQRRYPQKPARTEVPKPAPHQGTGVYAAAAAASASSYRVPDFAEIKLPDGSTQAEVRAFGAVARKHQLMRDELQLLLDELAHKRRNGAVRNGPALIDRMAEQLRRGEFYATGADRERQGGAGLSAEEARFINEGGGRCAERPIR